MTTSCNSHVILSVIFVGWVTFLVLPPPRIFKSFEASLCAHHLGNRKGDTDGTS